MTVIFTLIAILAILVTIIFVLLFKSSRFKQERQSEQLQNSVTEMYRNLSDDLERRLNRLSEETLTLQREALKQETDMQLNALLSPLQTRIDTFSATIADMHIRDNASRKSLGDQIERLMQFNATIGEEAKNLTSALRTNGKVQGDWGETLLESLLESAGLQKGINFDIQVSRQFTGETLRDESGRALRPDVVVYLPGQRKLIIDSKVSLTDYVAANEAEDGEQAETLMKKHIASIKRHVDELYSKSYQTTLHGAIEHVLMFIPVEGAYLSAVQNDASLWKYAYDRGVVIVSPTHLFSVMQIITELWRQEKQNRNAVEIARQAGALYDVFVKFTEEFAKLDRALTQTRNAYEDCSRRLSRSNQSLVAKAQRLRDLGVKTSRKLGDSLLDQADETTQSTEKPRSLDQDSQ